MFVSVSQLSNCNRVKDPVKSIRPMPVDPTLKREKMKLETNILGGAPCSQSVRRLGSGGYVPYTPSKQRRHVKETTLLKFVIWAHIVGDLWAFCKLSSCKQACNLFLEKNPQ